MPIDCTAMGNGNDLRGVLQIVTTDYLGSLTVSRDSVGVGVGVGGWGNGSNSPPDLILSLLEGFVGSVQVWLSSCTQDYSHKSELERIARKQTV